MTITAEIIGLFVVLTGGLIGLLKYISDKLEKMKEELSTHIQLDAISAKEVQKDIDGLKLNYLDRFASVMKSINDNAIVTQKELGELKLEITEKFNQILSHLKKDDK